MVVLDEIYIQSGQILKLTLIETFEKKPTIITKNFWIKNQKVRNMCAD